MFNVITNATSSGRTSGSRLSLEAVRAAGNAVNKNVKTASNNNKTGFRRRDDRRLTRLMLTVFCSFLVCFLPLTLVNAADNLVSTPSGHAGPPCDYPDASCPI